jgi:FkbM family methyltransferase
MSLLRTLAERVSRGVVLRRRLPQRLGGGRILVTPESALRFWRRRVEDVDPVLLSMVDELVRPGHTVWDVGGNVGLFAFAAAGQAGSDGHVLTIEPDPTLADLLRRSARLQPPDSSPVDVLEAAVAGSVGAARLVVARRGRSANHLAGPPDAGGSRETVLVPVLTLDSLLDSFPAPQVLKIDIEGAEALALSGAGRLLSEVRPTVICEVSGSNQRLVSEILCSADYALHDAEAEPGLRKELEEAPFNTIALPRRR